MRIFTLVLLLSFNSACGQKINCEEVLNKQPNFIKKSLKFSDSLFAEDVKILKHCGNFNEADSLLLKGPMLGVLMLKIINSGESATYGKIIKELQAEKSTDDYRDMLALQELGSKKVTHEASTQDKRILLRLFDGSEIALKDFDDFKKKNQNLTYKEAAALFIMDNDNVKTPVAIEKTYEFKPLISYENALTRAKKENKKVLLFFSAYGDVNSERMKEEIFRDAKVKSKLDQNFICFKTYVDNRTELPLNEQYFSTALSKKVTTMGQKFLDLQLTKFHSTLGPHFVILNTNGKLIKQLIGGTDKEKFLSFLHIK